MSKGADFDLVKAGCSPGCHNVGGCLISLAVFGHKDWESGHWRGLRLNFLAWVLVGVVAEAAWGVVLGFWVEIQHAFHKLLTQ